MARNKVQFQKSVSLSEFIKLYGEEEQCIAALFKWRWPDGFHCPMCGHNKSCSLKTRSLQQCNRCHHQASVTAGTIFEATKLPLTKWFQAMYLLSQDKKGVSAMELHRHLDISYNAAWRMKHKLMQVMFERDNGKKLSGIIEMDDAYLGGERTGCKPGRGAADKTPFVAAVSTTDEGHPIAIKLTVVDGFKKDTLKAWGTQHLEPGSAVITDGLACFNGIGDAGFEHNPIVCGGGRASVENDHFYWVNTALGNLKSALRSTYHSFKPKYAQRYLSEFQYRFNRRFELKNFIPRLAIVALKTPPMPERLLKVGLA